MSNEERDQLLEKLQKLLDGRNDGGLHIFNAEEVRHLKRAIMLTKLLTDRQIEALPEALDGVMFGRRVARWLFWILIGLGTIATNWDRIARMFGKGGGS